jgi:hypothetical protein
LLNLSINIIFIPSTSSTGKSPPYPTSLDWKIGVLDLLVKEKDCAMLYANLPTNLKKELKTNKIFPDFFIDEMEKGSGRGGVKKGLLQRLNCYQLGMKDELYYFFFFFFFVFFFLAKLIFVIFWI